MVCNNNCPLSQEMYVSCVAAIQDNPPEIPPSQIIPSYIVTDGINNSKLTAPINFAGSYIGNNSINVPCSDYIALINPSPTNGLTVKINEIIVTVPPLSYINEYFQHFNRVTVTAIDGYDFYTR